jgi:hypothetical protein
MLETGGYDLDQAAAVGSVPHHIFFLLAPLSLNSSAIFLKIRLVIFGQFGDLAVFRPFLSLMAVLEGYSVSHDSLDPAGVVGGVDAALESNGSSFLTLAVKLCLTVSLDLARNYEEFVL